MATQSEVDQLQLDAAAAVLKDITDILGQQPKPPSYHKGVLTLAESFAWLTEPGQSHRRSE